MIRRKTSLPHYINNKSANITNKPSYRRNGRNNSYKLRKIIKKFSRNGNNCRLLIIVTVVILLVIVALTSNFSRNVDMPVDNLNQIDGLQLISIDEKKKIAAFIREQMETPEARRAANQMMREAIASWENNNDEGNNEDQQLLEESVTLQNIDTSQQQCPGLSSTPDVTIITQTTLDRLWLLHHTCSRWSGNIVVALYIHSSEESKQPWLDVFNESKCPNVSIVPYYGRENPEEYPVNKLRNLGLQHLKTSHFMIMDIDFMPSAILYNIIKDHLGYVADGKNALVVPAFERKGHCDTVEDCKNLTKNDMHYIPETFFELNECVKKDECIVFQSDVNWEGHFTTNSSAFLERDWYDMDGKPRSLDCFVSLRYEPYIVLRWCDGHTPKFDERYHGYGKNKIEYISHLRYLGYSFSVLPEGFIIHHPHVESNIKNKWNKNTSNLHLDMDKLYESFLNELDNMYGEPSLTLCQNKNK